MADLDRRSSSHVSRRTRERRAYQLVVAGSALGVVGVVGVVLAVIGVVGIGLPVLALILAAICGLLFRRTVAG